MPSRGERPPARGEIEEMTDRKSTKQIAREAQAEKSFAKWQALDQLSKKVLSSDEKRVSSNAAKTAKLRALREARDASVQSTSKVEKKWRMPPPSTS
jgi:hypothetical protein